MYEKTSFEYDKKWLFSWPLTDLIAAHSSIGVCERDVSPSVLLNVDYWTSRQTPTMQRR
jgi:hypothetical protein